MAIVFYILGGIALLYISVVVYFFFRQDKYLFFPDEIDPSHKYDFDFDFEEVMIKSGMGKIHGVLFMNERPRGVVLFHHGNSEDLRFWTQRYRWFTDRGYDVLFYDYRGFGSSTGPMSEPAMHRDALACWKFLCTRYEHEQIVQYGLSLGTGVATRLAKKVKSKLLLLETPYYSMKAMADKLMPFLPNAFILKYPIRTDRFIRGVRGKIMAIHGTDDELVPYEHSERLMKHNFRMELTTIKGGMHNDLGEYKEYHEWLDKALL